MVLGAGDLGAQVVGAVRQLGAEVVAVDGQAGASGHAVADAHAVARLTDPDELTALIADLAPDVLMVATESVAVEALVAAESAGVQVVPNARSARLGLDREALRRLAADELGLPTVPFWFAGSAEELAAIAEHAGYPLVVKPVIAVPGEGSSVLLRPEDVEPAWQRAVSERFTENRVLAETVVDIDFELTLLTLRSADALLHFCEPIGHRPVDGYAGGGVLEIWQPQQMSRAAVDSARSIAARIVNAFGGRGVFGVELLVRGDEVYFADLSVRPGDSGLVTLRSQRLDEFELHARVALGLPVDTIMISPGAAEVVYGSAPPGGAAHDVDRALAAALRVPESDVRVFAEHPGALPHQRLGVALATAPDVLAARDRVRQMSTALRRLWRP